MSDEVGYDKSKPCSIEFKNVTKQVRGAKGVVYPAIYQVSGKAQPGEMMAIMGMSGSGKTTLLQVIGGRMLDNENVSGHVFMQGIPFDKAMRSYISYVWQHDAFFPAPNFTVRDQLMFTSYVQMSNTVTHQQMVDAVKRVLVVLNLECWAETSVHSVSGGEKRRLSIAKELLTCPRVLLIDEGTSGLDSAAAFDLLKKLKNLATKNDIPIVISIHQPSSRAFHLFDTVLMLSEGHCVYRGKPSECMKYVASFGFLNVGATDEILNPAEFAIEVLYSQEVDEKSGKWPRYTLRAAWLEKEAQEEEDALAMDTKGVTSFETEAEPGDILDVSSVQAMEMGTFEDRECAQAEATVGKDISGKLGSSVRLFKFQKNGLDEYQSSYFRQVYANSHRVFKSSSAVHFGHIHMLQNIFMAVLGGLVWYQIPNDEEHVGDFAGYLFFVVIYWFFAALFDGMLEFILERPSIRRELVSGDYRLSAYLLAKTLAGAPVKMVPPWIFVTISYWMVAKDADVKTYFAFAGIVILSTLVFNSVGMFIGSVTEDMNVASSLTNVGAFSILTLGGFYLKKMPSWLEFISSLSMFRFAYRAYVQVAYRYSGDVVCNGGSSIRACYWNDDGTVNTSGVISSAQAVQFILDAEVDSLGTNIYVLFIYCVAFRIFSYLALLWAERRILFKTA